jgi:hypothetical protein
VKRVFREPLLHFVLLGIALFVADGWLKKKPGTAPSAIVVTPETRSEIANAWKQNRGREPTPSELDAEIEKWIDEEVLYREGIARGLERDDAPVRARIASKMSFVLEARVSVPTPTEDELRGFYDSHRDEFEKPPTVDFIHVFVRGDDAAATTRADEILGRLRAGAEPGGLGDRFTGGRHYRGRKAADLEKAFGAEFVQGLFEQAAGSWEQRQSRHGLHLVRVEKLTPRAAGSFEASRLDVEKAFVDQQKREELLRAVRELRQNWKVER